MKKLIIDRFETDAAVCEEEDKSRIIIPRSDLPEEAKEGDCLYRNSQGNYVIDAQETKVRKASISRKIKDLWE